MRQFQWRRLLLPMVLLSTAIPGGVALAAPPGPGGLAPDLWIYVLEGPLPWALPALPDTEMEELDLEPLVEPEVEAEIEEAVDDMNAEMDAYEAKVEDYEDTLDTLRTSINAPTSAGDFDPGLEPDGSPMTLYQMADALGTSIGEFLGYARALRVADLHSSGTFFAMLFLGFAWVFFILVAKVVIGLASDIFNFLWKLWEAIPFVN